MLIDVPDALFRAYDIRGEYGSQLTEDNFYLIGKALGSLLISRENQSEIKAPQIILGRDGRLSSPALATALRQGLQSLGCDVIDLGIVPTPAVYFAIEHLNVGNAVMVTGSHNPAHHNGIKIVMQYTCFFGQQIQQIKHIITQQAFHALPGKQCGKHVYQSVLPDYIDYLSEQTELDKRLRLGVDCGNGAAGLLARPLFEKLGCEAYWLYEDLDGHFPNHSPDPTQPENLQALQQLVLSKHLDIGIAFDGDADRMIAVYEYEGEAHILWPDRVMMLLVDHLLQEYPDGLFLYDVKCSHLLPRWIEERGGRSQMIASGHTYLKTEMKRQQAVMGGEFSGHVVLADKQASRFYADDGLYLAVRLLEVLAKQPQLLASLHEYCRYQAITPEIQQLFDSPQQAADKMQAYEKALKNEDWQQGKVSLIDGFRVDFADAWGLARVSNTSSSITWRFEAANQERLQWIQNRFERLFDQLSSH